MLTTFLPCELLTQPSRSRCQSTCKQGGTKKSPYAAFLSEILSTQSLPDVAGRTEDDDTQMSCTVETVLCLPLRFVDTTCDTGCDPSGRSGPPALGLTVLHSSPCSELDPSRRSPPLDCTCFHSPRTSLVKVRIFLSGSSHRDPLVTSVLQRECHQ